MIGTVLDVVGVAVAVWSMIESNWHVMAVASVCTVIAIVGGAITLSYKETQPSVYMQGIVACVLIRALSVIAYYWCVMQLLAQ